MTRDELTTKIPIDDDATRRRCALDIFKAAPILEVTAGGTGDIYDSDLVTVLRDWQALARQNKAKAVICYGGSTAAVLQSIVEQWLALARKGVEL